MFRWTVKAGSKVDIQNLKEIHPDVLSFGEWLEKTGRVK